MHRFFITQSDLLPEHRAVLREPSDVKHLSRVLRAQVGELVELCVDHQAEWIGEVEQMDADVVYFSNLVLKESHRESPVVIDLFQGLPKADKMELIVQKNVELGVSRIIPVAMTRCVVKISDDKDAKKKQERWQKIADEAAKQSKRLAKVEVTTPIKFKAILNEIKSYDLFIIAYELEDSQGLKSRLESLVALKSESCNLRIGLLIGPEGGIDLPELEQLIEAGARSTTLGPRILRTETAGLAAVSAIQYALGDLG